MKHFSIIGLIVGIAFGLVSCQYMADFGPVTVSATEEDGFTVIDMTPENIKAYNRSEKKLASSKPQVDSARLYTDAVRPYDQLTLLVLDAGGSGAFANSNGPTTFGPVEVPESGEISFPYAGSFIASGKSLSQLQLEIQVAYGTVFNTAEVSLNRVSRRPLQASVIGVVKSASQHAIERAGVTLADLLARSGGTATPPHQCSFTLHRMGKTYPVNHAKLLKEQYLAQDGDVLEVEQRQDRVVTLMGAVQRPGNQYFSKPDSTLSDFLGSSAGLNLNTSNARGIYVMRKVGVGHEIYRFNLKETDGLLLAQQFKMHGQDLVYVSEAGLSRFGRAFRSILPFANQATNTAVRTGALTN